MYAGDPDAVRSWTARHGATLRSLLAAHAEFVEAVPGARRGSSAGSEEQLTDRARVATAAARLMQAVRDVADLPPVPDPPARELIDRLVEEVRATAEAAASDPSALPVSALRSSLVVVDLLDRLLQT